MDAAKESVWQFEVASQDALERFAADLAPSLRPGDVIALYGALGAGKSTFARALIRAIAAPQVIGEVPSPTFTLVQAYDLQRLPVAHFDLYRLSDPGELDELGFDDALEHDLVLIEWPEHAGATLPAGRLDLRLDPGGTPDARQLRLTGHGPWAARLTRLRQIADFLKGAGWGEAARSFLHGDASNRAYERLVRGAERAVFMNAPRQPDGPPIRDGKSYSALVHLAEDVRAFVAIAGELRRHDLSAPRIHAVDLEHGFVLLEDLGSDTLLDEAGRPDGARYGVAVDLLARMHSLDWPRQAPLGNGEHHILADYSPAALQIESELVLDWFAPAFARQLPEQARAEFAALWQPLFASLERQRRVWSLRDFHSPNLIWLGWRGGLARIGLIDFQDAVFGHPAYDLVSLIQDARIDMDAELMAGLYERYIAAARADDAFDEAAFSAAFATLGAQRNTKILGIFTRLWRRDGKGAYLRHLPRIARYLARNLAHPALEGLAGWYRRWLPCVFDPVALAQIPGAAKPEQGER
ncbi:MAG: tRNA (adenosine(37)-N6)-threonylcarbamoyltransferase complex ATPase subunit type 1 TsaE [Rhodobiaceae bacterium]|nr:tRNA (adenosine(37)-N6)-threonylcarbamoyltransferase complex ATPase subunit type 1 TsaE [Rhodobiaceae bacterium]